ncbi:Phosphatidylinositol:ceramide inositolphosphotransferase [Smittium mucronatum]|uniref:Phosphatidylinositol:ceramide inositolphosphotransferase n=1 Tax=Smittium mucronatum TaxID=133383 RepID=A0A1R0H5P4_9FUNG|nr:Phosphatidylinositol:ceramide inositolphosphotransferase [Smittium mucronatum]
MLWYTDFCVSMMISFAVIGVITYDRPWRYFSRFLLSWSIALLLRITTVATTSVPDPRLDCEFITGNPFTSADLSSKTYTIVDAVYSGHTTVYATCFMSLVSFHRRNIYGRLFAFVAFCLALSGSIIIVANRAHYTIDVLIAWYISAGSWYFVGYFWNLHVTRKGRFLSIEFPLGVGRHHLDDSEDLVNRRLFNLGLDKNGKPFDYSTLLSDSDKQASPSSTISVMARTIPDSTVSIIEHKDHQNQ